MIEARKHILPADTLLIFDSTRGDPPSRETNGSDWCVRTYDSNFRSENDFLRRSEVFTGYTPPQTLHGDFLGYGAFFFNNDRSLYFEISFVNELRQ